MAPKDPGAASAAADADAAADAALVSPSASDSAAAGAAAGKGGVLSPRGSSPSAPASASAAAGTAPALAAAGADAGGPVSSAEMLAAVRDVMAAAGLPLDPAGAQLMGRVAALQEKLTAATEQLTQVGGAGGGSGRGNRGGREAPACWLAGPPPVGPSRACCLPGRGSRPGLLPCLPPG